MELVRVFRLVLLLVCLFALGCKASASTTTTDAAVLVPVVSDARTDLLLTWIDDKGEFHVEQKIADVPPSARDVVRVADPVKDPPRLDDVFVADLRNAGPDGAYPVRAMSRPEFEKVALDRRREHGKDKVLTAQGAASVAPTTAPTVIIYGASWCGPCHQAAAYLKRRGIAFVEKDIEQDGGAAREMQAKLANAGMRSGSIPVIDVRGKLIVGFDERAVDRALGQAL